MTPTAPAAPGACHWRAMTAADLPDIIAIAAAVHPEFPEHDAVFANRLALHAAGCGVLACRDGIKGYVISHPWHFKQPPALNSLLDTAVAASTFYIHDLALLPEIRGSGAGAAIVGRLAAHATRLQLPNMTLVAVNNSGHFWQRLEFSAVSDPELDRKLLSYGDHARFMRRNLPAPRARTDHP